ncbi:MAG: NUDIX domain-containing protein [Sphingobacteriales bacterium]|nr:MAG: NUDIX domain-containing protein [Sphingobacteriales bacterium]
MNTSRKIYYNNKPLILTGSGKEYIEQNAIAKGYLAFTGAFPRNFRQAFQHLDKPGTLGAMIEDVSDEALMNELHKLYAPIDAGGGVVTNEDGAILMIYRRGKWDLPKGKLDDGEDLDGCAIREVSEETGLQKLKLGEKIADTYHVYSQYGENLLKHTAWYRMSGTLADELLPQKEENIMEAKWIPERELGNVVYKSYEAIREVLQKAGYKW